MSLLSNAIAISYGDQSKFTGIGCAGSMPEKLWIENQNDDDPYETTYEDHLALQNKPAIGNNLYDLHNRSVLKMLLSPFFLDRPPPDMGI
jgi:hypothetical protein